MEKDFFIFSDSVPILCYKLLRLPSMFHIENIQKRNTSLTKYYTFERLNENKDVINEAVKEKEKKINDQLIILYKLFNSNIDRKRKQN